MASPKSSGNRIDSNDDLKVQVHLNFQAIDHLKQQLRNAQEERERLEEELKSLSTDNTKNTQIARIIVSVCIAFTSIVIIPQFAQPAQEKAKSAEVIHDSNEFVIGTCKENEQAEPIISQ